MADCSQQSKRAKTHEVFAEDRISQLLSCILISILSLLNLDEAVRTSILSKFWRGLWRFCARLNFDKSILLRNGEFMKLSKGRQRDKFRNWVNQVLKSNKALALDEFRLRFELFSSTGKSIDKWLSEAFKRRVQRLELDFTIPHTSRSYYCFPRLLDQSTNFLISLSLSCVDVSGEAIENILHKFHVLEHLGVSRSETLVGSIKICGPSLALKHLEITCCPHLYSIILRDTRIESLKVSRDTLGLVLENNHKLLDICVYAVLYYESLLHIFSLLSDVEVVLTLCFIPVYFHQKIPKFIEVPQLVKVKQLIFVLEGADGDDFMHLPNMIGSFPNLERLVLKLNTINPFFTGKSDDLLGEPSSLPLPQLKEFELHGYSGRESEDSVVKHVLENAAALRKITIKLSSLNGLRIPHELCCTCFNGSDCRCKGNGKSAVVKTVLDKAKASAHRLKGVVPSSVEVAIL